MKKLSMEELGRISVDDFKSTAKIPVTIVLDNLRSLHNVGSVFRTADAFCIERIILTGITGTPPHREIEKTALGATRSVDWRYEENPVDAVTRLKSSGYHVAAVEQTDQSTQLTDFKISSDQKLCVIFGNEVSGVSDEVLKIADTALEIPQSGTKHSLNVSVCAGIVIWELSRMFRP